MDGSCSHVRQVAAVEESFLVHFDFIQYRLQIRSAQLTYQLQNKYPVERNHCLIVPSAIAIALYRYILPLHCTATSMTSESSESQLDSVPIISNCEKIETQVTFFPPLHDSRRAWVLDVLRKEQVTSVCRSQCTSFIRNQGLSDHRYSTSAVGKVLFSAASVTPQYSYHLQKGQGYPIPLAT